MFPVILALLAFGGYSLGAVIAARQRGHVANPRMLDHLLIIGIFLLELILVRSRTSVQLSLVTCAFVSVGTGYCRERIPHPEHHANPEGKAFRYRREESASAGKRAWQMWRSFAAECADYQARMFIGIMYLVFLWPFALFVPRAGRKLHSQNSSWQIREQATGTVEEARRQF